RGHRPRSGRGVVGVHGVGRVGAALPPRRRRGHGRREHRRGGPSGLLPLLGLEGLVPGRPARPRARRGRVLHAQEDRDQPVLLDWLGQRRGLFGGGAPPPPPPTHSPPPTTPPPI